MKLMIWILRDLLLATLLAVLGDIVATFLQQRFGLTDPTRFGFVAFVFTTTLILMGIVTYKRKRAGDAGDNRHTVASVWQRVGKLRGKAIGIEANNISSAAVHVKQDVNTVAEGGEATGLRVGRLMGDTAQNNQDVINIEDTE